MRVSELIGESKLKHIGRKGTTVMGWDCAIWQEGGEATVGALKSSIRGMGLHFSYHHGDEVVRSWRGGGGGGCGA